MTRNHPIGSLALCSGLSLVALALIGCMPDTSAPALPVRDQMATPTVSAVVAEMLPPEFAADPFVDVECLGCHQDEAQLRELAVEPEVIESLSEGPG